MRRDSYNGRPMPPPSIERRVPLERRRSVLRALWRGNFIRPRIAPRPGTQRDVVVPDWFQPQLLAVGILILLLCGADAILTLTLINLGANEVNPLMDPLVRGSGHGFAYWKFGLTAMGVVVLTLLARLRYFGRTLAWVLY